MPLIDSDTWISAFRSLNQLHFHPSNPRLPELPAKPSERESIRELCLREDVESLARMIAEKGYFRQDRLIVHVENGRNYVYEGNRRLCALKILARPDKAPDFIQRSITKLAEKAKLPKKVAVEIVPTRFDAEVVMFSKHALEKFQRGWKPLQQATFIASKLEQGEGLSDIASALGLKIEEVVNSKSAVDLYRFARLAKLSPSASKLVEDPTAFPYSTVFERLFVPKKVRKALGVDFGDTGLIVHSQLEDFLKLIARILDDVAKGRLDTRQLNTVDDAVDYVTELDHTPGQTDLTIEEAERLAQITHEDNRPETKSDGTKQDKSRNRSRSVKKLEHLMPKTLQCEHDQEKLRQLLEEAQRLKVQSYRYSAAYLLRSLLEVSLTVWFKHHRIYGKVPASNPKHGPTLNDMLDYLKKNADCMKLDPQEKGALDALCSRAVKISKAQLDRIVHSMIVTTHPEEVESIRELTLPILRKTLALSL